MIQWNLRSNVADVLSLGPRTSAKLLRLGVQTVEHLLVAKPHLMSVRLADDQIDWRTISCWQREAQLTLAMPDLGDRAIRLLANLEIASPQHLNHYSPTELVAGMEQLQEWQLHSSGVSRSALPDVVEVSRWITYAQNCLKDVAA